MEPEAAISVYMLFIEAVFCKKKKKKGWLFFFLEKEIPVLEACDKEALRRGLGSLPALPF